MNLPDPKPVLDLIDAFRRSKVMFAALTLGVFDRLDSAEATAAQMASEFAADTDALERLLNTCVALGLLHKRDGLYSNDPVASAYLCANSPHTLSGFVRYSDRALYPMWGNLADAVREGAPRWKQTFGLDGPIFSSFFRSEESMRDFLRGMHGFGMLTSPRVVAAFDLSRFHKLIDLGGATGHLAITACERYPELHAAVFDLPRVAALAREQVALSPASSRIEVIEGDFFEDDLPDADLFALGRILHDWSEEKIGMLLRKIFARLPAGGGILLAEKLLNEDGVGPTHANLQSLNMLVVTEGKERSLSGYAGLLEAAGFINVLGRTTGAPLDAILAEKP